MEAHTQLVNWVGTLCTDLGECTIMTKSMTLTSKLYLCRDIKISISDEGKFSLCCLILNCKGHKMPLPKMFVHIK